jgi:hypothetical protein
LVNLLETMAKDPQFLTPSPSNKITYCMYVFIDKDQKVKARLLQDSAKFKRGHFVVNLYILEL